jgi:GTP-binding protein HflX
MTETDPREPAVNAGETSAPHDAGADAVARVLANADSHARSVTLHGGPAAAVHGNDHSAQDRDGDQFDREDRAALRRVGGLSTELEDVTEVEYRQLRLENVVLIGIYAQGGLDDAENSLRELSALAETAGAAVLDGLLQRRPNPDPSTFLGKGKAAELALIVKELGADTVIADTELAPSQRRSLEDVVKVKVIDRTAVILDIFSQHAKSREGKAQVELAQLEYLLPRLRGWGDSMSRQAGGQVGGAGAGMGSRGPGETKIELDRRRIHTRMSKLRRQIKGFAPARAAKRANRDRFAVPSVAIAGYTNAGKSSLLNRLTRAGVLVENALFATLDPTVRKTTTPEGRPYTLADTVGFVRHLPHQLVEAFRSTLEEVADSDLIVHVIDGAHPDPAAQLATVRDVIGDVNARHLPEIVAINKSDLLDDDARLLLRGLVPDAVFVSAKSGEGLDALRMRIAELLPDPEVELTAIVPYDRGELVSLVHERGRVLETSYEEGGTRVHAMVNSGLAAQLAPFTTARTATGTAATTAAAPTAAAPTAAAPTAAAPTAATTRSAAR